MMTIAIKRRPLGRLFSTYHDCFQQLPGKKPDGPEDYIEKVWIGLSQGIAEAVEGGGLAAVVREICITTGLSTGYV